MTPQEINLAIAKLIYPDSNTIESYNSQGVVWVEWTSPLSGLRVDYCNDWNDLMPLVVEHGIVLYKHQNTFNACYDYVHDIMFMCEDSGPQLALANCLLKVLESKK